MNKNYILFGLYLFALVLYLNFEIRKLRFRLVWEKKSQTLTDHIYKIGGFDIHNKIIKRFLIDEYIAYELYIQEGGDCDIRYYQTLLFLTDFEPDNVVWR